MKLQQKRQEKGEEEREEENEFRFLERWQLNEAVECGTDGEWLQTQDNYFPAGGMEGARAPSLTGCSLLMDRGMGTLTLTSVRTYAHPCSQSPHTLMAM